MTNKEKWLNYFKYYAPNGRLYINCKYCPQLKDNSSLRKLVKRGVFTKHRDGPRFSRKTYLMLA